MRGSLRMRATMKPGDTVQVQQTGGGARWIYATVITPNEDGSAFVQVRHPGNIEDGKMIFFGAGKVRTKDDVQKLVDAMPAQAGGQVLQDKKSLQSQIEWLS